MTRGGTLLYDPHCRLCTRFARAARRASRGHLEILGIDAAAERGLLDAVPRARWWETMHHVAADGTVRSGPAGVAPVVAAAPGGRALVALLRRVPGARRLNARLYRWISARRGPACRHTFRGER